MVNKGFYIVGGLGLITIAVIALNKKPDTGGIISPPPTTTDYKIYKESGLVKAINRNNNLIVSNIDAATVINNIIQRTGKTTRIVEGNYTIHTPLTPANNVVVIGDGMNKTVLAGSNSLNRNNTHSIIERIGTPANTINNVTFKNFAINGSQMYRPPSYQTGNKGMYMPYCKNLLLDNILCTGTPATGLGCDYLINSTINNCYVFSCGTTGQNRGSNGIGVGTGAWPGDVFQEDQHLTIKNCICKNNANYGIVIEGQSTTVKGKFITVNNCELSENRIGIHFGGSFESSVNNCNIHDNLHDGIRIGASDVRTTLFSQKITINANHIYSNGGAPIIITSGNNYITITNNYGTGNNPVEIQNNCGCTTTITGNNFS